jgi:hypothetical protein
MLFARRIQNGGNKIPAVPKETRFCVKIRAQGSSTNDVTALEGVAGLSSIPNCQKRVTRGLFK